MTFKTVCDVIFKLYLYADVSKMVHYSAKTSHEHELADEVRNTITDFADSLAETLFGHYGAPKMSDMSLKQGVDKCATLDEICQKSIDILYPIMSEIHNDEKLSGVVSLVDDFKSKMLKNKFLSTFDRVANRK